MQLTTFKGYSQYNSEIKKAYRSSACGPTTLFTILRFHQATPASVSTIYKKSGCLPTGLSERKFQTFLQQQLPHWSVHTCSIAQVIQELHAGRPVAAKFDKWWTGRWFGRYSYHYHWVSIVGYEWLHADLFLLVHDNGTKLQPSRVRKIPYTPNQSILTFICCKPKNR